MTKKVPKKMLRIERHFFVNLRKKMFLAAHAAPRRRRFFWTGGAPPPPTKIYRREAADTMTSAHSSISSIHVNMPTCIHVTGYLFSAFINVRLFNMIVLHFDAA